MATYTERAAGIYRCTYTGQIERTFTDQETGAEELRWIWKFQEISDPLTTGQIDKITGTSLQSPNSNAYKMAAGIVGRKLQPGDDTETFIGQQYDVVYGPNQAGNLTITSVVKAQATAPASAAVSVASVAAEITSTGVLPELP
jgi:hypothetical protein